MTENGALRAGFILWQDGHGHWGGDGSRTLGPFRSKARLLSEIEAALERDMHVPRGLVHIEAIDPDTPISFQDGRKTEESLLLCVGCHRLLPSTTGFINARCPECRAMGRAR